MSIMQPNYKGAPFNSLKYKNTAMF